MDITQDEKKCAKCHSIKLKSEFNKDRQKKDGLRNYCKACEKEIYEEKKFKKEMGDVEENITEIINIKQKSPEKASEEKELEKYDTTVDHLAKLIARQYGQDIKKSDEVYDLFYNLVAGGDKSSASKEAITKALELRMSASDKLIELIKAATKLQEAREKGKGKKGLNMSTMRDNFDLD